MQINGKICVKCQSSCDFTGQIVFPVWSSIYQQANTSANKINIHIASLLIQSEIHTICAQYSHGCTFHALWRCFCLSGLFTVVAVGREALWEFGKILIAAVIWNLATPDFRVYVQMKDQMYINLCWLFLGTLGFRYCVKLKWIGIDLTSVCNCIDDWDWAP